MVVEWLVEIAILSDQAGGLVMRWRLWNPDAQYGSPRARTGVRNNYVDI
jgi:hypothetical protein